MIVETLWDRRHAGRNLVLQLVAAFIVLGLTGCAFNVQVAPTVSPLKEKTLYGEGEDKVLLVDLHGVISNSRKTTLLGTQTEVGLVDRVREILDKAEEDDAIKGMILRINSPGGTVTSSDIIYHELKRYKESRKVKTYAVIMDLAASGGYYVAQAADTIIAHPTSITGSIGVITLKINLKELMDKVGVDLEVVKSAEKKDFLSPFRPLTQEERKLFQETIDSLHLRFVSIIAENRPGLDIESVRPLADGRVFTAQQALDNKLVDYIGYLDDTREIIKKDLELEDYRIITYHRAGQYKTNLYSTLPESPNPNLINLDFGFLPQTTEPAFLYLWMP